MKDRILLKLGQLGINKQKTKHKKQPPLVDTLG